MAKKIKSRVKHVRSSRVEPPGMQYETLFSVKLTQLVSDGHTLYGVDTEGRVFAYAKCGWIRIDHDEVKLVPKKIDLDVLGKELASSLPDDQRHTKTLERNRAASERRHEIYQAMEPFIGPLERQMDDVRDTLAEIQKRVNQIPVPVQVVGNGARVPDHEA